MERPPGRDSARRAGEAAEREREREAKPLRAWIVTDVGSPADVMRLVQRESPVAGPGEIRVRVLVAGLSLPEVLMCREAYAYKPARPFTPGHEVVGVVLDANDQPGFEVGQRVMGVTAFYGGSGGHAEEALLIASAASVVPAAMPDEDAAVFTIAYQTAYIGLVIRAGLVSGENLLVHGAAGGTGFAAVQLGKALGVRVVAVARGPEKVERCRLDGASRVIDSAASDWLEGVLEETDGAGVDVVFDPVGGEVFERSVGCLAYGGRLVAIGFASGAWGEVRTRDLVQRNATVVGALAVPPDEASALEMKRVLLALYEKGALDPRVETIRAFEEVPAALAELEGRRVVGKQVVRISP
jgi:NADPH2:quinone reductase